MEDSIMLKISKLIFNAFYFTMVTSMTTQFILITVYNVSYVPILLIPVINVLLLVLFRLFINVKDNKIIFTLTVDKIILLIGMLIVTVYIITPNNEINTLSEEICTSYSKIADEDLEVTKREIMQVDNFYRYLSIGEMAVKSVEMEQEALLKDCTTNEEKASLKSDMRESIETSYMFRNAMYKKGFRYYFISYFIILMTLGVGLLIEEKEIYNKVLYIKKQENI